LVSEIFDLKAADIHTYKQNSTRTDNKGRLKLSTREPTDNTEYNGAIRKALIWGQFPFDLSKGELPPN